MIGVRGGIGKCNGGIGAEMPRQIERELHAGREFCKAFVDAELEEEGAVLVPQHDARRHRRISGAQRHDLAIAGLGKRRGGAADKGGIADILQQRGAALGFPAAGFQFEENLRGRGNFIRRARDVKTDLAMFGEAVALPAQLLQLLGAERLAQQFVGVVPRVETRRADATAAGADAGRRGAILRGMPSWRRHRA